ncbi:MAG: hypothetical protein AAFU60_00920 [Bacteroidota bacterium]
MPHTYPMAGRNELFRAWPGMIILLIVPLFFASCQKDSQTLKSSCTEPLWKSEEGLRVKGFTIDEEDFCFEAPSTKETAFNYSVHVAVEEILAMAEGDMPVGCKFLIRVFHPLLIQQPQEPIVIDDAYYDPLGRKIQVYFRNGMEMIPFHYPEEFNDSYLVTNPGLLSSLMTGQIYAGVIDEVKPYTIDIRGTYEPATDNSL